MMILGSQGLLPHELGSRKGSGQGPRVWLCDRDQVQCWEAPAVVRHWPSAGTQQHDLDQQHCCQ
eukprot:3128217-Rhodomonas_salina.1